MHLEIKEFWQSIKHIERELLVFKQNNRHENLEMKGIPNHIPDDRVQEAVINMLRKNGLNLNHYDIVFCHRLNIKSNGIKHVIVRFLNRKHAQIALINIKRLKEIDGHVEIIENLCPLSKSIYDKCLKLRDQNKIDHTWTYKIEQ